MTSLHEFDATQASVSHHLKACLHEAGTNLTKVRVRMLGKELVLDPAEAAAFGNHLMSLARAALPGDSNADATVATPAVDGTGTAAASGDAVEPATAG